MIFQQILLQILTILHKERTVSAAYHLLRGKRSGQTVQDVGMFKLHAYFGVLPKLQRQNFDDAIESFKAQGLIDVNEQGFYELIGEGHVHSSPYLNGWNYRGNEHLFFSRLALVVETISHSKANVKHFAPTQKNIEVQQYVLAFLREQPFRTEQFRQQFYDEVVESISQEYITEVQREILVARLSGNGVSGFTWQQLAAQFELAELDIQLLYISVLHGMLDAIHKKELPILQLLSKEIQVTIPLTDSANQTAQLFKKGYNLEQISTMRRLKTSTIEDHIIELVMNDPKMPSDEFIAVSAIQEIIEASAAYQTKKLRVLKEVMPQFSYFQIRLALAKGESE